MFSTTYRVLQLEEMHRPGGASPPASPICPCIHSQRTCCVSGPGIDAGGTAGNETNIALALILVEIIK